METTRTCNRCDQTKSILEFDIAGGKADGDKYRRRYCKTCYQNSKKNRRSEMRSWFENFKKTLKCKKCDNNDFRVLEFHHINGQEDKEGEISRVVTTAMWSKERIMAEIEKCDVLCANCHRIFHYENKMKKEAG